MTGSRTLPYGTRGREERAYGAQSHGSSRLLCSGLICTRETALMCVAQRPEHPSQALPFLCQRQPTSLLPQLLAPASLLPWQTGQTRGGCRAKREEAALGSQRACMGEGGDERWASEARSWGRGLFYIIVYVP